MINTRKAFYSLVLVLAFLCSTSLVIAQEIQSGAITLNVEAGFDGAFRDQQWMPIRVRVRNDGASVSGRLVVRPETSGNAILGTYSTPVSLPEGAAQTVEFAIVARASVTQLRIELMDDNGLVVASASAGVRPLQIYDRLYAVISESASGYIDLSSIHIGGYSAAQANWLPADLPDRAALLDPIDAILIHEADTGLFTAAQRSALAEWVAAGGHLIVTGGVAWQATAAGTAALLPLTPQDSAPIESLHTLGDWVRIEPDALNRATTTALGTLREGASVLVADDAGTPLLIRGTNGGGTVDYLTADPNSAPLRGWSGLRDVWFTLITSTQPQPGWSMGITDWDLAISASQIFPGLDVLPDILPLCGFLIGYIVLIGPVNYLVLNRLNRREWAWVTIPAFIVVFTVLAFAVGASLRGSDATINQLSVVRGWSDLETARTDTVIGLLSPRRARYSLTALNGDTLRPIPHSITGASVLANTANPLTGIDVQQSDEYQAFDFTVDASFIASFAMTGDTPAPQITGTVTLAYDPAIEGQMIVRGSVRNDGDFTLIDPVILARGEALHLENPLAPGDVATFDLVLPGESLAAPVFRLPSPALTFNSRSTFQYAQTEQSVIDIMGTESFDTDNYGRSLLQLSDQSLEQRRRQFFLSSFVDDAISSGRGDRVFVAGWSEQSAAAIALEGANWSDQVSTVYVIELTSAVERPTDQVTIPSERFSWMVRDQNTYGAMPSDIDFGVGDYAEFQFTPFPQAVLSDVTGMSIVIGANASGARGLPINLWNFVTGEWEGISIVGGQWITSDPAPYLGAQNAVRIRVSAEELASGFLRFSDLGVEQRGTF